MKTKNAKNSAYFYENEPVLVFLSGLIGGIATFLKAFLVKDESGHTVKKYEVRFIGEEKTMVVNDLCVFHVALMESIRNLLTEIQTQIGLMVTAGEKSMNYLKEFEKIKTHLPSFVTASYLRSHFDAQCTGIAKSIEEKFLKVDQLWESRDMKIFSGMEEPAQIQFLKEKFATIKDGISPSIGEETAEESAPAAILIPEFIPSEVAAAS